MDVGDFIYWIRATLAQFIIMLIGLSYILKNHYISLSEHLNDSKWGLIPIENKKILVK
jgi:hypothetical protein